MDEDNVDVDGEDELEEWLWRREEWLVFALDMVSEAGERVRSFESKEDPMLVWE